MFGIRHNIIFSATAHSILLAAILLIGGSSEIRKASLMTVLLSDEKESSSPGKQAASADEKQHAQPMITSKAEVKPAVRLPKTQEIAPKQDVAPLAPVRPQSDSDSGPASGLTGTETQHYYSSDVGGSSSSSVSSHYLPDAPADAGCNRTFDGTAAGAAPSGMIIAVIAMVSGITPRCTTASRSSHNYRGPVRSDYTFHHRDEP